MQIHAKDLLCGRKCHAMSPEMIITSPFNPKKTTLSIKLTLATTTEE